MQATIIQYKCLLFIIVCIIIKVLHDSTKLFILFETFLACIWFISQYESTAAHLPLMKSTGQSRHHLAFTNQP